MPDAASLVGNIEPEAERQRRIAREKQMIAAARAELDAGLFIDSAEVDAWIDSIGTDQELPVPSPRRLILPLGAPRG